MAITPRFIVGFLAIFVSVVTAYSPQVDYSQHVNPLIGSEGPIPGLAYGGG